MINNILRNFLRTYCEASDAYIMNLPSFDDSIVGVTEDKRVVYDYDLMVREFAKDSNVSWAEAIEFIEYNTIRSLPYIKEQVRPIIIFHSENINGIKERELKHDSDQTKHF